MIKALFYYKGDLVTQDKEHPCFSFLRESCKCDLVKFYPKIPENFPLIKFWLDCLTEWGFQFNQTKTHLEVEGENNYIKTVNLIFLRYLDSSEGITPIISLLHELSVQYPEIDKWKLFHAAHYIIYNRDYFNTNHTLLDHATRQIIPLNEFWANVKNLSVKEFYYGAFSDAMGNNRRNSPEIAQAIRDNNALELVKLLC